MDESHPRAGGPPWVRWRREAEDILHEAGAAILHLPDFYGPQVHVSTLQNALKEAAAGKTVNWLGSADLQREYIYVPDAMRIAAEIGARPEAAGHHWCLPGSGPLTGRQVAEIAGRVLGRPVKLRAAGMTMLRLVGLFNKELRGLPAGRPRLYEAGAATTPASSPACSGQPAMTGYETGIARYAGMDRGRPLSLLLSAAALPIVPAAVATAGANENDDRHQRGGQRASRPSPNSSASRSPRSRPSA